MEGRIRYWLPSASFTLYGDAMPKYKWLMSTYKAYFAAWRVYIAIYFETTRGWGFWLCLKHNRAILSVVGRTFTEFMKTPHKCKEDK